ncbi:MAG TPA: hypothetical protein DCE56_43510 [Cyanobacteria bacterium UBA8553]|nr:hypothetical protein [Cyanobacteria bacterium UBA8553]
MRPKHPWLKKCLEQLEKLPQICATATTEPYVYEEILADGKLTIETSNYKINYIFVIKSGITADTLDLQFEYLHHFSNRLYAPNRPLLITNDLSDFVIDQFLEKNIEFLDTNGTIYLNNPTFYILVRNSTRQTQKASSSNNLTTSTLKLAFTLLQDPQRLIKSDQNRLAELTGIDTKTVSRGLESLHNLGYLQRLPTGDYLISDYNKLLERWELGYVENLRPSLLIETYRPLKRQIFSEISDEMIKFAASNNLLIGGELGAAILTQYLRPIGTVLHIPEEQNYRKLMVNLRLVPDPQGNISFFHQFGKRNRWWLHQEPDPIADPLLLYAELMMIPDDRLKETAQRLYEKYIVYRRNRAEELRTYTSRLDIVF